MSRRAVRLVLGLAGLLLLSGCRGEPAAIEREVFIATYVDLRRAALANPNGRIRPEQRDEVLTQHGVTEDQLLRFTEVHGRDVAYMAEVWAEVESRLQPPESAESASP